MRTPSLWLSLASLLAVTLGSGSAAGAVRATQGFRDEHAQIKEHLAHIDGMVASLAKSSAAEQRKTADFVVTFLNDHIRSHAEWEEQHLYPAADKRTHAGTYPFTGSMRYEHKIIGRSIDELRQLAAKKDLDAVAFTRKTDRLLGLVSAHFEEEEDVLLPILDRTTTKVALEKELGMQKAQQHEE